MADKRLIAAARQDSALQACLARALHTAGRHPLVVDLCRGGSCPSTVDVKRPLVLVVPPDLEDIFRRLCQEAATGGALRVVTTSADAAERWASTYREEGAA